MTKIINSPSLHIELQWQNTETKAPQQMSNGGIVRSSDSESNNESTIETYRIICF